MERTHSQNGGLGSIAYTTWSLLKESPISYTLKECNRLSNTMKFVSKIQKHLKLHDLSIGEYLNDKHGLWLDFMTIDENTLHGTGRKIVNAAEGIILQIEKKSETALVLNTYIYIIMDAQLNVQNGRMFLLCIRKC